ncbi:MAG: hypothetical protein ACTSRH_17825 [Promethearchaeota archaeon]
MEEEIPLFFYNKSEDDKKALKKLIKSNIKCKFIGPIDDKDTPFLYYNTMSFYGLKAVELFIERWKKENQN